MDIYETVTLTDLDSLMTTQQRDVREKDTLTHTHMPKQLQTNRMT